MNDKKEKDIKNVPLKLPKQKVDLVMGLFADGNFNEAIDAIKALNKDYPNVPLLFNLLGACYNQLGQFAAAAQFFESAFTIKPDYAEAYMNHGTALSESGDLDSAVKSFKKAIDLLPNYSEAHNKLGITFLNLSKYDDAIEHLEWAVAYKYDFFEAHNNLGVANNKIGQISNAAKNFEKAI